MDIIKVEKRDMHAKAKQLRRNGVMPCNVYGGGLSGALSIQMSMQAAEQLCRVKREGSTLKLDLDGQLIPVQIKEKGLELGTSKVNHLSFEALKAGQKVNSVAHVLLKNEDLVPGVLEQFIFEVPFASMPGDMVDTVTIDLEGKPVDTVISISDIPEFQSNAVELKIPADSMVLRIRDKKRTGDSADEDAE